MGLLKKLNKSIKAKSSVMMAEATFEHWEQHPETEPTVFLQDFIDQVERGHPWYKYEKSNFEFTHDGHIKFKARFVRRKIAAGPPKMTVAEEIDFAMKAISNL